MITILIIIAGTACLTFSAIHALVWARTRRLANLLFALTAIGVVGLAALELGLVHSTTPSEWGRIARWMHVPAWVVIVGIAWFTRVYLEAGRLWLLWTIVVIRTLSLVMSFLVTPSINFREITAVVQVNVLGESLPVAQGVPNLWMFIPQATLYLLVIYSIDAAITVWRRGDRRRALMIGGSIVFFVVAATAVAVLVLWGFIVWPFMVSFFFSGMIITMGYEFSTDVARGEQLGEELRKREAELHDRDSALRASAKDLADIKLALDESSIVAMTDQTGKIIYVNRQFCEISGYSEEELIGQDHRLINSGHHPKEFIRDIWTTIASGRAWHGEIKNRAKDGSYYWVDTTIVPFMNDGGKPYRYVAIRHDITTQKLAEEEAHDLSGRLIHAQETERTRIARELHDDVSQSLALLSIQLQMLGNSNNARPDEIKSQVDELTGQIQRLALDVHRISHELHPAKLEQLGLESALRGVCNEIAAAHSLKISFAAKEVPRSLREDLALCVYRIAQESLQNVVKHSGATAARVRLAKEDGQLHLVVSDNGCGFDVATAGSKESLGLISMRERIRSVNGTIEVTSRMNEGTRVEARVPLGI